jgi:hypothetical protein
MGNQPDKEQLNPDIENAAESSLIRIGNILLIKYIDDTNHTLVSRASGFVNDHKGELVELSYVDPNQSISNSSLANPFTGQDMIEPICFSAIHGVHNTTFSIKPTIKYYENGSGKTYNYTQKCFILSQNYRGLEKKERFDGSKINIGDLIFLDGKEVNVCGFVADKTATHLQLSHFDPNSYHTKNAMIYRFTTPVRNQPDLEFRMSRFDFFYRLIDAYDDRLKDEQENKDLR